MRSPFHSATFAVLAAVVIMTMPLLPARAGDDDADYRAIRQAVQNGEIRSLSDILAVTRGKLPGDVVGVEIEHKHGHWQYEFRVADNQGRLFEVYVDAHTGDIERIKEK
ncbi:MAG TPA: PepSY domain-containing protein [Alphaproteobacteria bacterium]|nr:PepSY domain-containing protein [Alphaproteobacteria bacterium]